MWHRTRTISLAHNAGAVLLSNFDCGRLGIPLTSLELALRPQVVGENAADLRYGLLFSPESV